MRPLHVHHHRIAVYVNRLLPHRVVAQATEGWILPDIGPGSRITTIVKAANRIICFRKILYDS